MQAKGPIWCDPPSGHKYGFPKMIPEGVEYNQQWLLDNGYPKERIAEYGDHFYVRFWPDEPS